jgi:hypothetical protein
MLHLPDSSLRSGRPQFPPRKPRAGIPLYLLKRKACVNHIINTAEKVECRFGRNDRGSASRDKLSAKNLLRFVAAWLAHEAG